MNDANQEIAAAPSTPAPAPAPAAQATAANDGHGLGWPVCRCGHPMHPARMEKHQGHQMERFTCPRRRWWNFFNHPTVWEAPRD